MSIPDVQVGGIQNFGCTERDIYNYKRDLCNELRGHDRDLFYEHFLGEQEKNVGFTYDIKSDEGD